VDQKKLAAVEINFFDRRQRVMRPEEFAYLTKQMGPHGAAPSLKASMFIGKQFQVIMAIVSGM
jgi:hypothetical protein